MRRAVAIVTFHLFVGLTACEATKEVSIQRDIVRLNDDRGTLLAEERENSTSEPAVMVREYRLRSGEYTCMRCERPFTVSADGEWYPVDQQGIDEISVEEVDDRNVTIAGRLTGEIQFEGRLDVAEDGQSLTIISWFVSDGQKTVNTSHWVRDGEAFEEAHALDGRWLANPK